MMLPLRHYDFQTGTWTKRAIRKADDDEAEARRIAAELFPEPGREAVRQDLVRWLLAKPSRLERLRRDREAARRADAFELRSHQRKGSTMSITETLIAKRDAVGLATYICKNGGGDLSEASYTQIVTEHAARLYPDLSEAQAFTKAFDARDAAGELLRRAHAVVMGRLPDDKERDDEEERERERERDDDNGDALEELNEKAAQLRKARPELSEAQAFAKVYADPVNRQLMARERRQNSPLRRVV
jgi:hypothetical protein